MRVYLRSMASDFDVDRAFAEARTRWADHVREIAAPLTAWMIECLDLRPGQTVLDIAAGVGEPGFEVTGGIGQHGRLVSTDLAPAAVRLARERAKELGLSNVTFHVMDAQRMDLADASVDRALCRWGFMLVPDPRAALSEARRVVRPDGRLVFSVWGPAEANPWPYRIRRALEGMGRMGPLDLSATGQMFSLPDRAALEPLLEAAGWRMDEFAEIPLRMPYRDFDTYWNYSVDMGGEAGGLLRELSETEVAEVRRLVREGVRGFEADGGYRFPALALGIVAS
jgi:SAM-dependent methyltransferase